VKEIAKAADGTRKPPPRTGEAQELAHGAMASLRTYFTTPGPDGKCPTLWPAEDDGRPGAFAFRDGDIYLVPRPAK